MTEQNDAYQDPTKRPHPKIELIRVNKEELSKINRNDTLQLLLLFKAKMEERSTTKMAA